MNHRARRGTQLDRLHPLVLRQVERQHEIPVNVATFRRHEVGFLHRQDQVRLAELPSLGEGRRGRCVGRVAFGFARRDPPVDHRDLHGIELPHIEEFRHLGVCMPGGHVAVVHDPADRHRPARHLRVIRQREGPAFAGTMAARAVRMDDRRDILVIGHRGFLRRGEHGEDEEKAEESFHGSRMSDLGWPVVGQEKIKIRPERGYRVHSWFRRRNPGNGYGFVRHGTFVTLWLCVRPRVRSRVRANREELPSRRAVPP